MCAVVADRHAPLLIVVANVIRLTPSAQLHRVIALPWPSISHRNNLAKKSPRDARAFSCVNREFVLCRTAARTFACCAFFLAARTFTFFLAARPSAFLLAARAFAFLLTARTFTFLLTARTFTFLLTARAFTTGPSPFFSRCHHHKSLRFAQHVANLEAGH